MGAVALGRVVAGRGSVKVAPREGPGHLCGMAREQLSGVGEIVWRQDPDRFFTALFAPAEHREALFALYAFDHELARACVATREPIASLIRLQWWREVVEGARRRHEVAGPVGDALDAGRLDAGELLGIIDGYEMEVGDIEGVADLEAYALRSAGGVMVAAGRLLGMHGADALRPWGAAYGFSRLLRAGLPPGGAGVRIGAVELSASAVREAIATRARAWLGAEVMVPRMARSAVLPVVLARRRLAALDAGSAELGMGDRLAVVWSALR